MKNELYIGFDVHKDSITVAVAQAGRGREVRLYGTISNDLHAIEKLLTRLRKAQGGIHAWSSATKQAHADSDACPLLAATVGAGEDISAVWSAFICKSCWSSTSDGFIGLCYTAPPSLVAMEFSLLDAHVTCPDSSDHG
jgi:hypothetical protein